MVEKSTAPPGRMETNLQHCHSLSSPCTLSPDSRRVGKLPKSWKGPLSSGAREGLSRGYLNINQHNNRPVFPVPTDTPGLHFWVGGLQGPELLPGLEMCLARCRGGDRSFCATPSACRVPRLSVGCRHGSGVRIGFNFSLTAIRELRNEA